MIDVSIVFITIFATWLFFQNRAMLKRLHAIWPVTLILIGLFIISLFYLADLCTMLILPLWMPTKQAMMLMTNLHLNIKWVVSLGGVGFIVIGLCNFLVILRNALENAEAAKHTKSILEASPLLICGFVPDNGEISFVNDAFCTYFNKTSDKLLGHSFLELVAEKDRNTVIRRIQTLDSDNPIMNHEHSVITPQGIRWQRWTNKAIFNQNGEIIEYQSFGEDITEHKAIETKLKESKENAEAANIAKRNFLATMSHEIRTPMNSVLGNIELLLATGLDDKQRRYAETVYDSGESLLRIIDDILDFSKIEAEKMELARVAFSIQKIVSGAVDELRHKVEKKGFMFLLNLLRSYRKT